MLINESCSACRAGAPLVTAEESESLLKQLAGWQVQERDGVKRLMKAYDFKNFAMALAFTNKVGALAEEHGHHPDILTEWGKVTVTWWSHKIKGLHQLDFVLALKTSEL
mgnify:CR=1 FL=1